MFLTFKISVFNFNLFIPTCKLSFKDLNGETCYLGDFMIVS